MGSSIDQALSTLSTTLQRFEGKTDHDLNLRELAKNNADPGVARVLNEIAELYGTDRLTINDVRELVANPTRLAGIAGTGTKPQIAGATSEQHLLAAFHKLDDAMTIRGRQSSGQIGVRQEAARVFDDARELAWWVGSKERDWIVVGPQK